MRERLNDRSGFQDEATEQGKLPPGFPEGRGLEERIRDHPILVVDIYVHTYV